MDEIHRFNKAQQDAFLPHVERGDILLIGATTENPSFEVVGPLLSRARVRCASSPWTRTRWCRSWRARVADPERGLGGRVTAGGETLVAHRARLGRRRAPRADAARDRGRALRSAMEAAVRSTRRSSSARLQGKTLHYDKAGEEHYNLISALHKSVRNSDADASVYWLTRMLEAGEDRRYLARRLIRMAVEDIGLADVQRADACASTRPRRTSGSGTPEGELALVQAATYLARAQKSNAVYVRVRRGAARRGAAPRRSRCRCTCATRRRTVDEGARVTARGYRYAHDDPEATEEMTCLPDVLAGRRYFDSRRPNGSFGRTRQGPAALTPNASRGAGKDVFTRSVDARPGDRPEGP